MSADSELNEVHKELYELYTGKSTNTVRINQLWVRADLLESKKKFQAVNGVGR